MTVSATASAASATTPALAGAAAAARTLTAQQQAQVSQLSTIDKAVRAHEQAHLAAAGPYAIGGPSYSYATGPDGRQYAIGGEVGLDVSPDPSDPERTIQKAETIQAAANAPADPSSQDRAVAAQAARMEAEAQQQILAAYQQGQAPQPGQLVSAAG